MPPGRTLSQNDWPKTTRKLILSPQNLRVQAMWQSSPPGFPYPTALPLPNKISCFVSVCLLGQFISNVRQEPTFRPWKGFPFLQKNQSISPLCLARFYESGFSSNIDFIYEWYPSCPGLLMVCYCAIILNHGVAFSMSKFM